MKSNLYSSFNVQSTVQQKEWNVQAKRILYDYKREKYSAILLEYRGVPE